MGTDDLFKRRNSNNTPKRKLPKFNVRERILIVCEGEKTEKNYFQDFRRIFSLTSVVIKSSPHSAPTQIVAYADKEGAENSNKFDEIYCVFDRDKHGDFDEALQKVDEIKSKLEKDFVFKTIVSDPCFEFWILCHFTATTQHFGGNSPCLQVQNHKDFKKNLPNYSKDYDFRELIEKCLQVAIKNAEQVNKENLQARQTPYTEVVELVESLQKMAKE